MEENKEAAVEKIRRRIFDIVEAGSEDWVSQAYDVCMIAVIVASLVPPAFKYTTPLFWAIERVAVCVFILDYLRGWGPRI